MRKIINIARLKFVVVAMALPLALLSTSCSNDEENDSSRLSEVSMKTQPKVKYVLGESLDLTGMVISLGKGENKKDIPYSSFGAEGITTEPENGKVLGFTDEAVIIKLSNTGKGMTQAIQVTNDIVELIVKTQPKRSYVSGEILDLSNLVITTVRENRTTADVAFADFGKKFGTTPMNGNILTVNNTGVVISYLESKVKVTQLISVIPFEPLSATLVTGPTKNVYEVGERLNLEGTVINYVLPGGLEIKISNNDFTAFGITTTPANDGKLKATDNTVQAMTTSGNMVAIPLTINPLNVTGMALEMKPAKTLYVNGELINLQDLSVRLTIPGKSDLIVASQDFDIYGITTNPVKGTAYVVGTNNIVVTYPGLANTISIPLGSEIVYESNFTSGLDGWIANKNDGGSVNFFVQGGVAIANNIIEGSNPWSDQLIKPNLPLLKNVKYKLTVQVKANPGEGNRNLGITLTGNGGSRGYGSYDGNTGIQLPDTTVDNTYQTFTQEFTMTAADDLAARLQIGIGSSAGLGKPGKGVMIKYVKLEKL